MKLTESQQQFIYRVALDLIEQGIDDPTPEQLTDAMATRLNREATLMSNPRFVEALLARVWAAIRAEG